MIVIGAFWGQSIWNIILLISAFSWASIAKQVRAKVKSVKNRKYVVLAESFGASPWYIVRTHMMGEVLPLLSVNSIAVTGKTIIQESSLAYLGLSDPLAKSWGLMIQNASSFTAGILWPRFDDQSVGLKLALIGSINDQILNKDELAAGEYKRRIARSLTL